MNAAVVGLGWWGQKVLRNFIAQPECEKVYGFDTDPGVMERRLSEMEFVPVREEKDIWNDPSIVAVAVVTPVRTHYPVVCRAFENGKHVLVAKPPASTVKETEKLVREAAEQHLVFMVDSTFVYSSATQSVRTFIGQDRPSGIRSVQILRLGDDLRMHHVSRIRNTMFNSGIDVIADLVFHDLCILFSFLSGELRIRSVHRIFNLHPGLCDTAYLDIEIGNVPVHISYSWSLPERRREIVIQYPDLFLVYDDLSKEEKVWTYEIESQKKSILPVSQGEPLFNVVGHFLGCIREKKEPVTGSGLMIKVMKAMETIQKWHKS